MLLLKQAELVKEEFWIDQQSALNFKVHSISLFAN